MEIGFNETVLVNATALIFPTESEEYLTTLKVLVAATSVLSVIGSSLIILTYLAFPDIRTKARELLVFLSVCDFLVAISHLIGLFSFYEKLTSGSEYTYGNSTDSMKTTKDLCTAQAVFEVFGTESSIFWTVGVAVYIFIVAVLQKPKWAKRSVFILHVICWGIPLILTLWLAIDGFLGYELGATPGFCAVTGTIVSFNQSRVTKTVVKYPIILGYELWLYIAFIVLPVLYITTTCRIKILRKSHGLSSAPDSKLLLVPVIFMVLRIWSVVVDISTYYLSPVARAQYRLSYTSAIIGALEGIGDSGQGAANGILFCLFTKIVRVKLKRILMCVYCKKCLSSKKQYQIAEPITTGEDGEKELHYAQNSFAEDDHCEDNDKLLLDIGSYRYGSVMQGN